MVTLQVLRLLHPSLARPRVLKRCPAVGTAVCSLASGGHLRHCQVGTLMTGAWRAVEGKSL